ncbi:similar to Saccharomyces cerevisiae YDR072C IPT1 Inositolphosphotransferase [Maudiozyma barnettii]|uniref:Similar to Saccharomyces cerevisiae YDR072C IPT1 Inositolphosphotransferase n=1 Tax=Maudiozyma barnettii TaxID=61262 RepID=A0A8H2ZLZ8_9SACH|nr:inositolphosphotransferase [Kazachstania barnettii]CAB4256582.1 similar to Saccharomyces cerevisiae YDR072C IPT1 Inositolphosphotransferase [Kazachstania barnettii]CAD1785185.1 similar to Saccharomyces cerevisiae YDR072C IPT1 Inositolphosphotransferase [Kazachstania barnettii]
MIQSAFLGFFNLIVRIIKSGLNKRNIFTLPLNFFINFSPVIIWLSIFHHAGMIPLDIRPQIHSKIAFISDAFLFGDWFGELQTQYHDSYQLTKISIATAFAFGIIGLLIIPLSIWYYLYHIKSLKYNIVEWYDHIFHFENKKNTRRFRLLAIPFLIPFFAFIILNVDHTFSSQNIENFTKTKDIIAWFSYVILHVTVPILTAVYLYVFHPAGTIKCFSFALGLQNICGVFTHLLFPTASPWFTHMYGINDTEHVNYTQEGFAAGLVRVDNHLGTHLNTNGFHLSPIVFGAVPSLHSAIAFQCFLFIITRASSFKHRFASNGSSSTSNRLRNGVENGSTDDEENDSDEINSKTSREESIIPSNSSSMSDLADSDEDYNYSDIDLEATDKESCHLLSLYTDDAEFSNKWYFKVFNTGLVAKLLISSFILLQWWATMYLDHHYRFDLFIGLLYSITSFIIINNFVLQPRVLKPWLDLRFGKMPDDNNEARTMGMRVFKGTKIEWFFDPLA